jgi:hypothetical protein
VFLIQFQMHFSRSHACHVTRLSFSSVAQQPKSGLGRFVVEVSRSHPITHTHTRQDSSERVISSTQRPLPTQRTTNTRDEHPCPQRDSNPDPSNEAAADPRLGPRGHRDRLPPVLSSDNRPDCIQWNVEVVKLLLTKFSSAFRYFRWRLLDQQTAVCWVKSKQQ